MSTIRKECDEFLENIQKFEKYLFVRKIIEEFTNMQKF